MTQHDQTARQKALDSFNSVWGNDEPSYPCQEQNEAIKKIRAALQVAPPVTEGIKPPLGKPSEWVDCPICRSSDMRKSNDGLIYCINHNCASNGGTIFSPEWKAPQPPADAPASEYVLTGWALVPIDPTTVQVNAGVDADDLRTGFETVKHIYRAMIAAVPNRPKPQPPAGVSEDERAKALERVMKDADSAYIEYIRQMEKPDCLGFQAKMNYGKFGLEQLEAHCKASHLLGQHRGIHHAIKMLSPYLTRDKSDERVFEETVPAETYMNLLEAHKRLMKKSDERVVSVEDARAALKNITEQEKSRFPHGLSPQDFKTISALLQQASER